MISKICPGCNDPQFIPSDKEKCLGCLRSERDKKSTFRSKQIKVYDKLRTLQDRLGYITSHDKTIKGGFASERRPDIYYKDFGPDCDLIVEIDEEQHSTKTCGILGELIRLISLYENDIRKG